MHRVVIYGGAGGIGLATARALRAGRVASSRWPQCGAPRDRRRRTRGDRLHRRWRDRSGPVFPRGAGGGPRLEGLVDAIGTIQLALLAKLDAARIEADFRINALGAFLAVQAATSALRAGDRTTG